MSEDTRNPALQDNAAEDIESILRPFGYASLFSCREEIADAFEYVKMIGESCQHSTAVITACFVYVNTLLRVLHHNGMLNLAASPLHARITALEAENEDLKRKLSNQEEHF